MTNGATGRWGWVALLAVAGCQGQGSPMATDAGDDLAARDRGSVLAVDVPDAGPPDDSGLAPGEDASVSDGPASDRPAMDALLATDLGAPDVPVDVFRPECLTGAECDDGVACTDDACEAGRCRHAPVAARCDDGVACTEDACTGSACRHTAVPARCGAGEMCDPMLGCQGGRICATDADCADTNPCTTRERCDAATRVCEHDVLDGDGDGHPPRVCAGDDCDDSRRTVFPGATETCNGRDDNCNATVDEAPAATECGSGFVCQSGACACPSVLPLSCYDTGARCVDPRVDGRHCGRCNRSCGDRGTCVAGACQCQAGTTFCEGYGCIELRTSDNCGACGARCTGGTTCVGGACQCPAGQRLCDGRCLAVLTDRYNCGACGNACPFGVECAGGACQCPGGQTACGGQCVDVQSTYAHCGACGRQCGTTGTDGGVGVDRPYVYGGGDRTPEVCLAGTCQCPAGRSACDGACVDMANDPYNCGGCYRSCGSFGRDGGVGQTGTACVAGSCACPAGQTLCGDWCYDLSGDRSNCGACDRACGSNQACVVGSCRTLATTWSRPLGSPSGVAVDGGGNVYVTGSFRGSLDLGGGALVSSSGSSDIYVASYTAAGAHRWSRRFGLGDDDSGRGIAVDASGNVCVVGSFQDEADFGGGPLSSNGGEADLFVASFTSGGVHRWSRAFGSRGSDWATSVAVGGGEVFVTGVLGGAVDFGGGLLPYGGYGEAFLVSLGGDGAHRWSRAFDGTNTSEGLGVAVRDANVFVVGHFQGSLLTGGESLYSAGSADAFIAGYTTAGVYRWSRRAGDRDFDAARGVATDPSGNLFVVGGFQGALDLGGGAIHSASQDGFLASYTSAGGHRWSRRLGYYGSSGSLEDVATDASGNVYVTGSFSGWLYLPTGVVSSVGSGDALVARFAGSGTASWARRFGGAGDDAGRVIALDPSGAVLVAGAFSGTSVDFGAGPVSGATSGLTGFLARLTQ